MTTVIDPQAAVDFMIKAAPKFAKAKAERIYLEEYRKTIKARLMKGCGLEAIGAQEREAYAHQDYASHLDAIREAVEAEETLRWQLVAAEARVEVWRSQEASNRTIERTTR